MTKRLISVILITIAILASTSLIFNKTYAADTIDDVMGGAQSFLNKGTSTVNEEQLLTTSNMVFNALLGIAIVAAVIVGMIIGIQLMTAGIEEKAKFKEALVPYIISCIVVFGAFGIWKLAVTILSGW